MKEQSSHDLEVERILTSVIELRRTHARVVTDKDAEIQRLRNLLREEIDLIERMTSQREELRSALWKLAKEAQCFVHSANVRLHGRTNIGLLQAQIDEARGHFTVIGEIETR